MRLLDKVKQLLTDRGELTAVEIIKELQSERSEVTANTISTRVGDHTLGALHLLAHAKEMTLSEFMRETLEDEVEAGGFKNDKG